MPTQVPAASASISAPPVNGNHPTTNHEAISQEFPDERRITILYMTQSGTSEDVAARIARIARRKHYSVALSDVSNYDVTELINESLVLFIVSTTGQGEFPTSSLPFWNFLLRKNIPEGILADLQFAAFGLGDSSYPRFCWPVRLLSRRLTALGAQPLTDHGEGDDMHYLGIEGTLGPWLEQVWTTLDSQYPLPDGIDEIGRDELLPPSIKIEEVEGTAEISDQEKDPSSLLKRSLESQGWTMSQLLKNQRMTAQDHFQDVRLLEFSRATSSSTTTSTKTNGASSPKHSIPRSGTGQASLSTTVQAYELGDVLCLHPINDDHSVNEILDRLQLDPSTLIKLSGSALPSNVPSNTTMTLFSLFRNFLDFTSVPRSSFFEQIRLFSPQGSIEREKLDEYCGIFPPEELKKGDVNPQDGLDECFEYAMRTRRTIKEVLEEFKSVQIPLNYLGDVFPWIKAREFSIASSPNPFSLEHENGGVHQEDKGLDEGGVEKLQLAVAIVKYRTKLRKPRTGLCTRWLQSLEEGSSVPVFLKKGYLKLPPVGTPLILVGPGTGCAPLRSLILDRLSHESGGHQQEVHLFLGFRYRSKDYLFGQDWQTLAERYPNLNLQLAFSRDGEQEQGGKVYVQDQILQQSQRLWDCIIQRQAWIIVAGSSGKMPEQVRSAFEKIAQTHGHMDEDQAKRFFDRLESQKRWQEECW